MPNLNPEYETMRGKLRVFNKNIDDYYIHPKTLFLSNQTPAATPAPATYKISNRKLWLIKEIIITGSITDLSTALDASKTLINLKSKEGHCKAHENVKFDFLITQLSRLYMFTATATKLTLASTSLNITIPVANIFDKMNLITINLLVLTPKN